jgi:hypothetical protein
VTAHVPINEMDDLSYTKQFFTITREGHTRPAPEIGAPALVWHIAFWPNKDVDPQNTDAGDIEKVGSNPEAFAKFEVGLRREYAKRRQALIDDFNALLHDLQKKGRAWRKVEDDTMAPRAEQFGLRAPADWFETTKEWGDPNFAGAPLPVFDTDSIGFTIWWPGAGDTPLSERSDKLPGPNDLRVRVQADVHADYGSIAFYIEPGKAWGLKPICSDAIPPKSEWERTTDRRAKILSAISHITQICERRTNSPLVSAGVTPEPDDPTPDFFRDADSLKAYADYLYDGIWTEFCSAFALSQQRIAGATDKVFANFRGVVLATRGTGNLLDVSARAATATTGNEELHRFTEVEANAVVKGFWPFLRRLRPDADFRDWIACGVFDWRALYVSSLGSQSEFDELDEGKVASNVPAGALPQRRVRGREPIWSDPKLADAPTTPQGDRPAPFRYLFLTKYEPHRKQIGRLVERVNALGTMRLYALKNWSIIRDADAQIRIYGQELDATMKAWTEDVRTINKDFKEKQDKVTKEMIQSLQNYTRQNKYEIPPKQLGEIDAPAQ